MVVASIDQGVSQRQTALDDVIKAHERAQAQMPRDHWARQVGIDHEGAHRVSRQCAGQREHQGRAPLCAMATGEEQDLGALPFLRIEQNPRQRFKAIAPLSFKSQYERWPLELDR